MSFYFGILPNGPSDKISPALQDRGINYLRTAPSMLKLIGLHSITQPGYSSYVSCLPAAMYATHINEIVHISNEGYPVGTTVDQCFPIPTVPVIFTFSNRLTETEYNKWSDQGMTRQLLANSNRMVYMLDHATPELIRSLRREFGGRLTITSRQIAGYLNIDAYNGMIQIIRIFSGFFRTHGYPAFSDPQHPAFDDSIVTIGNMKRKRDDQDEGPRRTRGARVEGEESEHDVQMDEPTDDPPETPAAVVKIYRVKPNPVDNPWGPVGSIPTGYGMFFPFVEDLAAPDNDAITSCISRYFIKALGPSMVTQSQAFEKVRSAVGVLNSTRMGHILAHLATCISIGLSSQVRIYPVFSDTIYEGCVNIGAEWSLGHKGMITYPVNPETLSAIIRDSVAHASSLTSILVTLGRALSRQITSDQITSFWSLHELCIQASLTENEKISIGRLAANLNFDQRRFRINAESLNTLFKLLTGDKEFSNDTPIHPAALFSQDRTELALSCFGFEAPSFLPDGGTSTSIQGVAPSHLAIRTVPLPKAVLDMKLVRQAKTINVPVTRLSVPYKFRQLNGRERDKVWELLKEFCETANEGEVENEAGGRGAAEISFDDW